MLYFQKIENNKLGTFTTITTAHITGIIVCVEFITILILKQVIKLSKTACNQYCCIIPDQTAQINSVTIIEIHTWKRFIEE